MRVFQIRANTGRAKKAKCRTMKAHQRKVREQASREEIEDGLFGAWWEDIDTDIKKATVAEVTLTQAKGIIEKYEWMGCLAAINERAYGIFFEGVLGGVVVYGLEYSENLGHWDKYGYTGKMLLLNRGACVHWAHPHSASKLIRGSMRLLPEKYKVVTATVDELAGEVGTIYQACGFDYIGSMREANPNIPHKKQNRSSWEINGKLYGGRSVRRLVGSVRQADILERYPGAKYVAQKAKRRYFAFLGSKKEQKENRKAIEHLIKPYPKRGKV